MRQFITIAVNAFMELVRQPVFLLLMTTSAGFSVFLAAVPYFGFGDDPKLVKDSTLAVMLLSGLFGAILSASASVAQEIRSGTALAVLAKPVSRAQFLLAKYAGLAAALTLLTYVNLLAALIASRMAFDSYGQTDTGSLGVFFGLLVLAYLGAGMSNYFLRRPFVADAVVAVVLMSTVAFILVNFFVEATDRPFRSDSHADWRLVPAAVLILFALWTLAGIAVACSTRFEMLPTLAICTGVFLLGLMSDYLFGRRAEAVWRTANLQNEMLNPRLTIEQKDLLQSLLDRYDRNKNHVLEEDEAEKVTVEEVTRLEREGFGQAWWATLLYSVVPNWQLFWLADALEGTSKIPWSYVGRAFVYVVGYLGAALALAIVLFQERELS